MNLLILKNAIQEVTTETCGEFQLYFYKNLFDLDHQSKILNNQKLSKVLTLETRIKFFQLMLMKTSIALKILKKNLTCNSFF